MESGSDSELRAQLETVLGRRVSDDEWESFRRAASTGSSTPAPRRGWASSIAHGTVGAVGFLLGMLLAGAVVYALLLGLAWAYNSESLEDEEFSFGGLLVGAFIVGFFVVGAVQMYPRAAPVLLGIGFAVGLVALAVGVLLQLAA